MNHKLLVCLFLIITTFTVYCQVVDFEFVGYDDNYYVTENPHVQKGLSLRNIIWAFTATVAANWHPLTLISHILDYHFFGMEAGFHHLTSLFFHTANILLLFLILRRMTGDLWRSAFVAAAFSLHPLHVESVAWIAERKDVLSTFFWMLTIWSYIRYAEQSGIKTYLPVFLFLLLGLMAKPMLVTLPFVLILLDYWPLGRMKGEYKTPKESEGRGDSPSRDMISPNSRTNHFSFSTVPNLFLEKIPLFILSAASSIITFIIQQSSGAVADLHQIPVILRFINALVAYAGYILKMFFPFNLAAFYPYPDSFPWWQIAGACLLSVSVSLLVIRTASRHPYAAMGWFWYLGTLVPVIGLIHVGEQAMADRYTYIPLIGLFIMVAWSFPALLNKIFLRKRMNWKPGLCIATTAILVIFAAATWVQVRYWNNNITLWEHALETTTDNYIAHHNLGIALTNKGNFDEALHHHTMALRLRPENSTIYYNIACLYAIRNMPEESIKWLKSAIEKGFNNWANLKLDKDLDNIRTSPYFKKLLQCIDND